VFDIERLTFFNTHYLKNIDIDSLYNKLTLYLSRYNKTFLEKISAFPETYNKKILGELRTKMKKFDEFETLTSFLYGEYNIANQELLLNEKMKITDIEIVKK
jgi:glutamyl-tRNA synthetase/nondiscriminating glutamyl-tRNA synthetase